MSWDIQTLFQRHAGGIRRSLCRKGMNAETASDLTQDTFLRVIAMPPGDSGQVHNPKAYLYKVSRNLGINHQRREQLVETVALDDEEALHAVDPTPAPDMVVHSRQCLARTYAALEELPERTRCAFEMHRMGERTLSEIADELGVSTTRAWGLVREAYKHLMNRVGEI